MNITQNLHTYAFVEDINEQLTSSGTPIQATVLAISFLKVYRR